MRALFATAFLAPLALAGLAAPARADAPGVAGVYDVKFTETSTNCIDQQQLKYAHGQLRVEVKGRTLTVDIERTPLMSGTPNKAGKISAKSKLGHTRLGGMKGVFSVAGRVTPEGMLSLVMVGEYSTDGRALCTQSWNVTGPRADAPPPPPPPAPPTPPRK